MKSIFLIWALVLAAFVSAPLAADEQLPQAPAPSAEYGPGPGSPLHGVEPPPGSGHWEQAPEGWVWVPEFDDPYAYAPPAYADVYVYAPGYYYWGGTRWLWRAARWVVRDYYRDRYWTGARPYAPYYRYGAAPRARYRSPGRSYLRYDYWRDNRPLVDR